ncbi:hypothetical protein AB3N04_11650 [Alkalihalophilus sp. As8PL]|uniref:Uncharacterized protein n=1 Tax=Alkalihalophilus sp. As8PL TaxID=3237103 RepID=A0AB39BPG3_9BACI
MASGMIYYSVLGNRGGDLLHIKPEQPNDGLLTLERYNGSVLLIQTGENVENDFLPISEGGWNLDSILPGVYLDSFNCILSMD